MTKQTETTIKNLTPVEIAAENAKRAYNKGYNEAAFDAWHSLDKEVDELTAAAWNLAHKLTEDTYKYTADQFEDMITLGELAKKIMAMRAAACMVAKANIETR